MKKLLFLLSCFLIVHSMYATDFYYYKDQRIPLNKITTHAYILTSINREETLIKKLEGIASVEKFVQDIYQQRLIKEHANADPRIANPANYFAEIKFTNANLSHEELEKQLLQLRTDPAIINTSYCYTNSDNDRVAVTNYIWVGLKDLKDISILKQEVNKINFTIVGQNPFMPEWVMLCPSPHATHTQVQAAIILHETDLFLAAEPELFGEAKKDCVNDPLFNTQWGLQNTGNNSGNVAGVAGMDTRVCNAWPITTGSNNVDIAIIDEGVENNHPDLSGNLQNTGYNAMTATSPNVVFGSHGTACAGIAAASGNNNLGVSGVAYNADWFAVSVNFNTFTWAQMSDGFNWARTNGAEILSNSWGWNNPSALFDAAVTNALNNGRGGLGCMVLFSAGNDNLTALIYPKNSNPDLVIVGAMSPCGQRKSPTSCDNENWWGSNHGTGLDVMAPGVIMATTDRQGSVGYNTAAGVAGNYTGGFNGTSSACPHAAGVAALILSVNECLTRTQVDQIMKRTSRKVGGYNYNTNTANGTWNNEMGHGLLDAGAAVQMAGTKYLQNLTNNATHTHKGLFVEAGFNVNPFQTTGNYVTGTSSNVIITAQESIDFQTGCDLQGTVNATIGAPGACNTW